MILYTSFWTTEDSSSWQVLVEIDQQQVYAHYQNSHGPIQTFPYTRQWLWKAPMRQIDQFRTQVLASTQGETRTHLKTSFNDILAVLPAYERGDPKPRISERGLFAFGPVILGWDDSTIIIGSRCYQAQYAIREGKLYMHSGASLLGICTAPFIHNDWSFTQDLWEWEASYVQDLSFDSSQHSIAHDLDGLKITKPLFQRTIVGSASSGAYISGKPLKPQWTQRSSRLSLSP